MNAWFLTFRKNSSLWITLLVLAMLFFLAISGMSLSDWVITLLRGLSVGAATFLVASGFSIIFGLLGVLNLAHGTLFMIGAYIGWMVYIRPDTFIDVMTPLLLVLACLLLSPIWDQLISQLHISGRWQRIWPWIVLVVSVAILWAGLSKYPLTSWDPGVYEQSPISYSYLADQGQRLYPAPVHAMIPSVLLLGSLIFGSLLGTFSLAGFHPKQSNVEGLSFRNLIGSQIRPLVLFAFLAILGVLLFVFNNPITIFLEGLNTTWLFLIAVIFATVSGFGLGALLESTLVSRLYSRPIYQLMLSLGLSVIGIEIVRAIWGQPEFVMPKPDLFNGSGQGCPATSLTAWLTYHCSTISFLDGRIRIYNEILLPVVGLAVLGAVWFLLQRSRLGMIIRAGVQDREMVEALGINVRRVFTLVYALGVGLAAFGGALAAPSLGLSNSMGETFMVKALIALAIGGLTSFPGAAVGSFLVGLVEQFIIKYGQIGIHLPFLTTLFKPSPPLVPASTVLLMVIILLALPQGLFGRKE